MLDRRDVLRLGACGAGAVVVSALAGCAARGPAARDFHFVQLSDTHWGYEGPANPDAAMTLPKAVASVNALSAPPDFIVFTGDLTHTTDDAVQRRRRMAEFRRIADGLTVRPVYFMPGEHDAGLDGGEAFREAFGPTHYTFAHEGVRFIVLDNVSQPGSTLGEAQLQWLQAQLAPLPPGAPLVVFTHRPLFDLVPRWDWATRDGARALALLMPFQHVTVFYGHIHQAHHHRTGHIEHHAARSLVFALPAPGSQPERTPLPWDPAEPYKGLGWRDVDTEPVGPTLTLAEQPVVRS
jgi:3',5'-cyclic AMP phosphodiesterase CpdA